MQPFEYVRADEADAAIVLVGREPDAQYLAGGTTQLDLMKDGVLELGRLVDITRLPLRAITRSDGALHVGASRLDEVLALALVPMSTDKRDDVKGKKEESKIEVRPGRGYPPPPA